MSCGKIPPVGWYYLPNRRFPHKRTIPTAYLALRPCSLGKGHASPHRRHDRGDLSRIVTIEWTDADYRTAPPPSTSPLASPAAGAPLKAEPAARAPVREESWRDDWDNLPEAPAGLPTIWEVYEEEKRRMKERIHNCPECGKPLLRWNGTCWVFATSGWATIYPQVLCPECCQESEVPPRKEERHG